MVFGIGGVGGIGWATWAVVSAALPLTTDGVRPKVLAGRGGSRTAEVLCRFHAQPAKRNAVAAMSTATAEMLVRFVNFLLKVFQFVRRSRGLLLGGLSL